jgi:hypothetical protein
VYVLFDEGMCCYDRRASERGAIGGVSHISFFELRGRFCELKIVSTLATSVELKPIAEESHKARAGEK